jgi:hypothetical protein
MDNELQAAVAFIPGRIAISHVETTARHLLPALEALRKGQLQGVEEELEDTQEDADDNGNVEPRPGGGLEDLFERRFVRQAKHNAAVVTLDKQRFELEKLCESESLLMSR